MKTEWDYSNLADAYLLRPDYSDYAIDAMLTLCGIDSPSKVCDVGAGVAHLTLMLAARKHEVVAVEPNDAMRKNGIHRTAAIENVRWCEGTGEETGQEDNAFRLVTFGSSFNVCNRQAALLEASRILEANGWFACMWNHRNLDDPIQREIEGRIKDVIPSYQYGARREDQTSEIDQSNLFHTVVKISSTIMHEQSIGDCVSAWESHATLDRQAGEAFPDVIANIKDYLLGLNTESIQIPYSTNIWIAQLK